jgi:hypothetical protein
MRKWLFFAVCVVISVGSTSVAKAKSNFETANEFVAAVENLTSVKEIDAFLSKHLDKSVAEQVKQLPYNKFAWKDSRPGKESTWWVIYESKAHALASAWLCKGDPPEDATIIEETKRR